MAIRIITDSSSDLSAEYAKANDVEIIPLRIIFGEESFTSGVDLTNKQFFEKLAAVTELPKTSQPTPGELSDCFNKYLDAGDEVVAIFISDKMSGTYKSACLVKETFSLYNLHIVDSNTVTFALGVLVMEAVRLREEGLTASEIYERIEATKDQVVLYASVGTLKYLQMGGRLSSTSAFLGSMLNFKPIITIKDGLVESIDKQRGQKRAYEALVKLMSRDEMDLVRPRSFAHSHAPEAMEGLIESVKNELPVTDTDAFERCDIGATVGVHIGPGATGFAYFRK